MKNYFKAVCEGGEIVSHNRMTNAFEHWQNGETYAAYIAVMGGGHRLDKLASVTEFNDNVARGELYATYKINLSAEEFPYPVTSVGFCPYEGASLSDECMLEATAPAEITGTIFLERTEADFDFYPGENPLVRSLLGMREMPAVLLKGKVASLGNRPAIVDVATYEDVTVRTSKLDGLGLYFSAGDMTDFAVVCEGKPCMRFNFAEFASPEVSVSKSSDGGFYLDDVSSVLKVSGEKEEPFGTIPAAIGLLDSGAVQVSGFEGYKFLTDPLGKHVALYNGSKLYAIDEDMTVRFIFERQGDIHVCSDGEIVSVNRGTVVFGRSGNFITVPQGDTVVLYKDGGYDIFIYIGERLLIFRYDGSVLHRKDCLTSEGGKLYRANDYSVVLETASGVKVYDRDGEIASYANLPASATIRDGCFYEDGAIGSFHNGRRSACDKSCGRFMIRQGGLFYFGEDRDRSLIGDFDFDEAAQAGSMAVFLTKGQLSFYRIVWDGVFVSVKLFGEATCTCRRWSAPGGAVKLSIINKGG